MSSLVVLIVPIVTCVLPLAFGADIGKVKKYGVAMIDLLKFVLALGPAERFREDHNR